MNQKWIYICAQKQMESTHTRILILAHWSSPKTSSAHAKNCVAQPSSVFHSVFVDTLVGILFFKTPTSCWFLFPMIPSRYPIGTRRVSQGGKNKGERVVSFYVMQWPPHPQGRVFQNNGPPRLELPENISTVGKIHIWTILNTSKETSKFVWQHFEIQNLFWVKINF